MALENSHCCNACWGLRSFSCAPEAEAMIVLMGLQLLQFTWVMCSGPQTRCGQYKRLLMWFMPQIIPDLKGLTADTDRSYKSWWGEEAKSRTLVWMEFSRRCLLAHGKILAVPQWNILSLVTEMRYIWRHNKELVCCNPVCDAFLSAPLLACQGAHSQKDDVDEKFDTSLAFSPGAGVNRNTLIIE